MCSDSLFENSTGVGCAPNGMAMDTGWKGGRALSAPLLLANPLRAIAWHGMQRAAGHVRNWDIHKESM